MLQVQYKYNTNTIRVQNMYSVLYIQVQLHKYKASTIQVQYKYNKSTIQVQYKYNASIKVAKLQAMQIQYKYNTCTLYNASIESRKITSNTNTIQIQYMYIVQCKYRK